MANKYSKYQLKPFASQYVDPQGDKIMEIYRKRYDQNKQKKNQLDQLYANINSVSTADEGILNQAKEQTKQSLQSIVQSGAYEDAGIALDDAVQDFATNKGLIAVSKSYQVREKEKEWQAKATAEGKKVLDFGRDATKNHSSWTLDPETGEYKENIYTPKSEMQHDYNAAIKSYMPTIKADASGISQGRMNQLATRIMGGYLQSPEGDQHLRNLMQLQYDQNLPEEQRQQMAMDSIFKAVRLHTDEQVHSKAASSESQELNARQNAVVNSIMGGSHTSVNSGYTAADITDLEDRSALDGTNLYFADKIIEAESNGKTKLAQDYRNILDNLGNVMLNEGTFNEEEAALYKKYESDLWKDSKDVEKFGTMIKYMTEDQWTPDFSMQGGIMGDWMSRTGVALGIAGAVSGGAALTGVGAVVAPFAFLGAGVYAAGDLAVSLASYTLDGFGNVRDVMRPETPGIGRGLGFVDSEQTQLMQNVENLDRVNNILGTEFTEKDLPMLKTKALEYFKYKTEGENGITGDQIAEKTHSYEGSVFEGEVWKPSTTEEGKKATTAITSALKGYNVNDFRFVGVDEGSDIHKEITEGKIDGLVYQGAIGGDIMGDIPARLMFKTQSGNLVIAETKTGAQNGTRSTVGDILAAAGKLNFLVGDIARQEINQIRDSENRDVNLVDLNNSIYRATQQIGGEQGLSQQAQFITYQETFKQYLMKVPQAMSRISAAMKPFEGLQQTNPEAYENELNRFIFEGDENQPPLIKLPLKLK